MTYRNFLMTAAAVLIAAASAEAQSVAAKWAVEYPTRVTSQNGAELVEKIGRATLTIDRVVGDSIFGKWLAVNSQDSTKAVPPRRIAGAVAGNRISFVGEPVEARMRRNMGGVEDELVITMTAFFEGTITGPSIEGTMYSKTDDDTVKTPHMKWAAKAIE